MCVLNIVMVVADVLMPLFFIINIFQMTVAQNQIFIHSKRDLCPKNIFFLFAQFIIKTEQQQKKKKTDGLSKWCERNTSIFFNFFFLP